MPQPTTPATPAPAAAPVTPAPATPAPAAAPAVPAKESTTSKLFKHLEGSGVPGAPKKQEEKAPVSPAPTPKQPDPQEKKADEVLDLTALKDKKFKIIVGGKEEVVSAEDAIKRIQLESHLTKKAQALDQREHDLNERDKASRTPKPAEKPPVEEESLIADDPVIKKVLDRMSVLERENAALKGITMKQVFEDNMSVIGQEIKSQYGFDDFGTFRPKLEEAFRALPPEEQKSADNRWWWIGKYQELKLKDMSASGAKVPKAPEPPAERPASEPMLGIDGGAGGKGPALDDWDTKYATALEKAKATGSPADWAAVMRLKDEVPKPA